MKMSLYSFARLRRRTVALTVGVLAPLATLGIASPALAVTHHPTGEFAKFADCPLSNPELTGCVYAETSSGEFTVGKRTVPINKPIILQGGIVEGPKGEIAFQAAEDGNTLTKVPLAVPGGLLNIVAPEYLPKWLREIFNNFINEGITGVTETTELAGPASNIGLSVFNLLTQKGTALSLPTKIKLSNAFLGGSCYVGSNSHPIVINFTTGTTEPPEKTLNKPITGTPGELSFNEAGTLITLTGGRLVNNTFAAPEAEGCGGLLSFLIDPAVDAELGLPSGAGYNTAILEGTLSTAESEAVTESE
ncbi:MAG TPA: hypothetical protein VMG62_06530 [Solirubrobacteraceae bacterium]|nr:hypothetical protein [Solirubrobacteraceae bacterium]